MSEILLEPRIVGLELEYMALFQTISHAGKLSVVESLESHHKQLLARLQPDNVPIFRTGMSPGHYWLGNGAKYHMDVGEHWEYATPECASFDDAVAYDMAGEDYVNDHLGAAITTGLFKALQLNKRVVDQGMNPATTGAHENYSVESGFFDLIQNRERLAVNALATHLVTRSIYTGAGSVDFEGIFHVTQKLRDLSELAGSNSTTNKPIISLRDESLMSAGLNRRRLHVISGDANISPWATWMKLGTTSLVARLLEHDCFPADAILSDALADIHKVDPDTSMSARLSTMYGSQETAISVQRKILDAARKLGERLQLPQEEYEVIDQWQEVLDDLEADPESTMDRIDWILRQQVTEGKKADKAKVRDLGFDVLNPISGSGIVWRDRGNFRRTPSQDRVEDCRVMPPKDTRAAIRGEAVRYFSNRVGETMSIGWANLTHLNKKFFIPDPYDHNVVRFHTWVAEQHRKHDLAS